MSGPDPDPAASSAALADHVILGRLFQCFNERRLTEASLLFAEDAVLEHAPVRRRESGRPAYLAFAQGWLQAFPDAMVTIERIDPVAAGRYEVDLLIAGTHLGPLDMGTCGVFPATGAPANLRLRQLLEIQNQMIAFSSLSFDLQDVVSQLVRIDVAKLLIHLGRIRVLGDALTAMDADAVIERRNLVNRIGAELDAARRVVRPQFDR